jgi:co-chaperonin GroES (HSP10)
MIKICGHRVLLKMEKLEDADPTYKRMRQAGFALAETEETKRMEAGLDKGTVIEVGPDAFKAFYLNSNPGSDLSEFQPWCKAGDFVAFAKYSGKLIEDPEDGQKYMVINDEDVVAVLGG